MVVSNELNMLSVSTMLKIYTIISAWQMSWLLRSPQKDKPYALLFTSVTEHVLVCFGYARAIWRH